MHFVAAQCSFLSFFSLLYWNSAFRCQSHGRFASIQSTSIGQQDQHLLGCQSRLSFLRMAPFFDHDYYTASQPSSTDLSPADIFLSLLESQLAIIVQSTNITHAAIYMSSEADELRDNDEEPVMQLVCSYPPTPSNMRSNRGDFDDFESEYRADTVESNDYDNDKKKASSSNARSPGSNNDDSNNQNAENTASSLLEDNEVVDMDMGGQSLSTVYPIQFQGLNLGILQTMINKAFKYGDVSQDIPVFDFYDFQSSTKSSSWNPYKSDSSPSGCRVCESVAVAMGASIALELIRISSLAEATASNSLLKQREDNVFLRSSSAVITIKTLLKLLSKRLPKDDDIGLEIIKTIQDQSDSISESIVQLVSEPTEQEEDIQDGQHVEEEVEGREEDEAEGEIDDVVGGREGGGEEEGLEGSSEEAVEVELLEEQEIEALVEAAEWEAEEDEDDVEGPVFDTESALEEEEEDEGATVGSAGLSDIPFVVRTLEVVAVTPHHATHLDEAQDYGPVPSPAAPHFFPLGDRDREVSVDQGTATVSLVTVPMSVPLIVLAADVPQNLALRTEGVDFLFLETFVSKEKEVFVTFDGTKTEEELEDEDEGRLRLLEHEIEEYVVKEKAREKKLKKDTLSAEEIEEKLKKRKKEVQADKKKKL